VLQAVRREIAKYSSLFDILCDLDTHCCVLEPVKPTFALTARRYVRAHGKGGISVVFSDIS